MAEQTPIPSLFGEFWDLVAAYAKQETVAPLAQVRRFLLYGVAGGVCFGFGVVFMALGALRALQSETGSSMSGNLSWIPYLIVVVGLVAAGAGVWWVGAIRKDKYEY